jgi:hypothetical protein
MASKNHDFIVATISRKCRELGFNVVFLDGRYYDISAIRLLIPPKILNHRPDVVAQNYKGNFCIGEAKTLNDLKSKRTRQQIIDFHEFVNLYPGNYLVLGIPLMAESALNLLFRNLGLNYDQVITMKVPEELFPKN